MGIKRYAKDYTTDVITDPNGRSRKIRRYTGPDFYFSQDTETLKRGRIILVSGIAVSIICNLVSLVLNTSIMHSWFTSGPHIMCMLGNVHLVMAFVNYISFKEPFTREDSEHTFDRLAIWSMLNMIFSFAAVIACIFWNVKNTPAAADVAVVVLTTLLFSASVFLFSNKGFAKTRQQ